MSLENLGFEDEGAVPGFPAGGWRLEEKASSFEPAGFGAEPTLTVRPDQFDDGSWTKTGLTVAAEADNAPDGTATADQLVETATTTIHRAESQAEDLELASGRYTWEAFLKFRDRQFGGLRVDLGGGDTVWMMVDLQGKKITAVSPIAGDVEQLAARLVLLPDDWLFLRLYLQVGADIPGALAGVVLSNVGTSPASYLGDISKSIYAWGGRLRVWSAIEPFDSFEESLPEFLFLFDEDIDLSVALFDVGYADEAFEDFEELWSDNETFLVELAATEQAVFDVADPEAVEDFEEEWDSNEDFVTSMGPTAAAEFGSAVEEFEAFEAEWRDNQNFEPFFDTLPFEEYLGDAETFSASLAPIPATVSPSNNRLLMPAHGFGSNERVTVEVVGGTIAGGITPNTVYWAIVVDSDYIQISDTEGPGAAVDITSSGSGAHFVRGDPAVYFTTFLDE